MPRIIGVLIRHCLATFAMGLVTVSVHAAESVDEIVVTSSRAPTALQSHIGNIASVDQVVIEDANFAHIHELLTQVAGVWVSRGSGQESLPSIRSPVLTGAGSCGAFLTLEDGIPSRPNGFCNINQLFELPTELATGVEVIRGPGNALYGSNSLHGTINVLLPEPGRYERDYIGFEIGSNDFVRIAATKKFDGISPSIIGVLAADDGGFRDESGYRQYKGFFKKAWSRNNDTLLASLSFSKLEQETAGFILGLDSYRDPLLNRQNLNPEAFRNADSQRVSLKWTRAAGQYDLDVRPYLRRSKMIFLQHFLPGQPVEENGHTSFGVLSTVRFETDTAVTYMGIDLDVADVYLRETQFGPTEGSDFLSETRPEGAHYDYDVLGKSVAAYVQSEIRLTEGVVLSAGLRGEYTHYNYDNNMLTGNTRDDGTTCGFGGCLYSRPAGRSDDFVDLAPKFGILFNLSDTSSTYLNFSRGFRAPQMTELYRLQSGQQVSDLKSEKVDSIELGIRVGNDNWNLDGSVFSMRKKNSVYRDAEGFNVSGGRSRHNGLEAKVDLQLHEYWNLAINGTYARHEYDFDVVAARGETFTSGRDIDTAPRWQGSAVLRLDAFERLSAELEWVSLGSYYVDAANEHAYPGHDIANLRVRFPMGDRLSVSARLNNISDRAVADRADFAFGNYRYFPGRGREFFLKLAYAEGVP
jgi:outer membrane receptor protein involved in Fe transport